MIYKTYGKRILELAIVIPMFILTLPVMLVVAILVRCKLGSPIFFVQERTGHQGSTFWIYKFRTMLDMNDKHGAPLPDDQRLTKFGKFLRASSLDELPSLLNIIKGDMNLVGPRPLISVYLERFNKEQARRQNVKPGLTGWAQINGRNLADWESKFQMDTWYVENMSLWLDLKIILKTPWTVLSAEGITAPNHASMPEFMGTEESEVESASDATDENTKHYTVDPSHETPPSAASSSAASSSAASPSAASPNAAMQQANSDQVHTS